MTPIAGRYQPLEAARPHAPLRARDLTTAQTVWLRELDIPPDLSADAVGRARSAVGIFHPSLVTLFDVALLATDRMLLAYEFVPAQTVAQVSGGAPFNLRRAAEVVAEIADAVAELHARGVVHGAISHTTVLITMKGKAKLDRVGDPSLTGWQGLDPAVDVVALGELLRLLAGRPSSGGVVGAQAIEVLIERACRGGFESVSTLAAMLRRL